MTRARMPYLVKEIARGRLFWYFRRGRGLRIRIHGDYGSPEFMRNYESALLGAAAPQKRPPAANGTLGWLIDCYKGSSAWERLSATTKSQRALIYKGVLCRAGDA